MKKYSILSLAALLLFLFPATILYAAEDTIPNTTVPGAVLPAEETPPILEGPTEIPPAEVPDIEVPDIEAPDIEAPNIEAPEVLPPESPSVKDFTVEAFEGTYYVTSSGGLNVRSGPGTDYNILGSLPHGKEVRVTGKADDWFEISYHNTNGYISAQYTSPDPVLSLPLHEEEMPDITATASDEAKENQGIISFSDNLPLVLLFLAILITIAAIIVTVFGFFRHSADEAYEEYDDEEYDDDDNDGEYDDSDYDYDDDDYGDDDYDDDK